MNGAMRMSFFAPSSMMCILVLILLCAGLSQSMRSAPIAAHAPTGTRPALTVDSPTMAILSTGTASNVANDVSADPVMLASPNPNVSSNSASSVPVPIPSTISVTPVPIDPSPMCPPACTSTGTMHHMCPLSTVNIRCAPVCRSTPATEMTCLE